MCRVLEVKEGSYYAWRHRGESARSQLNVHLATSIKRIVAESNRTYGSRRVTKALRQDGISVNRKRVARLMIDHGIRPFQRKKANTYPKLSYIDGDNVLNRRFRVTLPNSVWASDITNIQTREGWLYLAVTIDLFSRRVVGWSMDRHRHGGLALEALSAALKSRKPHSFLHHSDRGTQFTSAEFFSLVSRNGGTCSLSRKGNCWDNAVVESFFATLKRELFQGKTFATRAEARAAVFSYIEGWYNRRRLHSYLGYRSPEVFERQSA
jgi:transposase InsO family protein